MRRVSRRTDTSEDPINHILSHRQHGQTLQPDYQKGKAVRAMRVSLTSFETLSDRSVATLSEVRAKHPPRSPNLHKVPAPRLKP